jgi:hypothetical protein
LSKRDQWRKTVEEQLPIKDNERQSIRRIMSRLRGNPDAEIQPDAPQDSGPVQNLDRSKNEAELDIGLPEEPSVNNLEESVTRVPAPVTACESGPVQNLDRSKNETSLNPRPVKPSTVSKSRPVQNLEPTNERKAGYLKLPNEILDTVLPHLSPTEAVVFLRLFRLSIGFGSNRCTVGITALIQACNISEQTCRTALRRLIDMSHIMQIEVINTKELKGTTYEILTGLETIPVKNLDRYKGGTGLETAPNKDHDHDDFKRHDHHQSEVMTIYSSITGNEWTKADQSAYEKIKHLSAEVIEQAIRVTLARAPQRPGSLAYFVKEILAQANPAPATRAQRKRELQAIIDRIRTANAGRNGYPPSEFAADIKDACAREGIVFDSELFNEMVG